MFINTDMKMVFSILILEWDMNSPVKDAFRKASMKYHPDRGGTHEDYLKIHDAYEYIVKKNIVTTADKIAVRQLWGRVKLRNGEIVVNI